jgi:stage V sporulation protein D (sporulation-specific penicillin-binding protein)
MNRTTNVRITIIYIAIVCVGLVLLSRLFLVQVVHGKLYAREADSQYVADTSYVFDRGTIYFGKKDGSRISAATLRSGHTLAINPTAITDPIPTYEALSSVIEIDREDFIFKATKRDDPYEEIAKQLDDDTTQAISELDLDGVILAQEKWRFYPGGSLGAQTLGFVGWKGDILAGRYGLERYYEDILQRGNHKLYVNFFAEVFSNVSNLLSVNKKNNREGDIITTIEWSVQQMLEEELSELQERWDADSVGGIVINPQTGGVYALASHPTFDPNSFNTVTDQGLFVNPLVENVYEMGSIIKALTMAAGLDSGAVTADTTYVDEGSVVVDGARIANYDGRARGEVNMQEVLNQSLNTGVVFVTDEMGKDTFRSYMKKYGLTEVSGVDLPNDTKGLTQNLSSERSVEYATASFGQGIAFTPFTTVRALSVLANGGMLVTPHIMKEIDYSFGFSQEYSQDEPKRVISEQTSDEITRMLVEVVDSALRGGTVKMEHYSIAAKTGTAQMARPDGGYYDDRYLHTFFGYYPAYDPQFLVFLYVEHPKEVRYASETLTPPFMDIATFLINYYDVPPDR